MALITTTTVKDDSSRHTQSQRATTPSITVDGALLLPPVSTTPTVTLQHGGDEVSPSSFRALMPTCPVASCFFLQFKPILFTSSHY